MEILRPLKRGFSEMILVLLMVLRVTKSRLTRLVCIMDIITGLLRSHGTPGTPLRK